jgi:hypothetical protein
MQGLRLVQGSLSSEFACVEKAGRLYGFFFCVHSRNSQLRWLRDVRFRMPRYCDLRLCANKK